MDAVDFHVFSRLAQSTVTSLPLASFELVERAMHSDQEDIEWP
mgnify:CR=1 FL=1